MGGPYHCGCEGRAVPRGRGRGGGAACARGAVWRRAGSRCLRPDRAQRSPSPVTGPATPPDPARAPARSMPTVRGERRRTGRDWSRRPGSRAKGGIPGGAWRVRRGFPDLGGALWSRESPQALAGGLEGLLRSQGLFWRVWGLQRAEALVWGGLGAPGGSVWAEGRVLGGIWGFTRLCLGRGAGSWGVLPVVEEIPGLWGSCGGSLGAWRAPCVRGGALGVPRRWLGTVALTCSFWGSLLPAGLVWGSLLTCGGCQERTSRGPLRVGSPSPPCP